MARSQPSAGFPPRTPGGRHGMRGVSMIEVLVTIVIISIGLLGLAGLQVKLQASEMEAYQRTQALLLLQDMASRISTNGANALNYVTGTSTPLGTGDEPADDCATLGTNQLKDACEWSKSLQGSGERASEDADADMVGAMLGARGCVESLGSDTYLITVAWQGLNPLSAPPTALACGKNAYDGTDTGCVDDLCRRVVTTLIRVGT